MKKYIISEAQFNRLIELKKKDKNTIILIETELNRVNKALNEGELLNEAIVDTIRKFLKKGLLTTAVISSLLANNNVNAQQLASAGVPQDKIEQVASETGSVSDLDKIEKKLLNTLQKHGDNGTVNIYNKLPLDQKNNVLNAISQRINSLNDIDNYSYKLSDWIKSDIKNIDFSKIGQKSKIEVDSITVSLVKDYVTEFTHNSAELVNPEATRDSLQKILNNFVNVNKIVIVASSSTLRNTGEFEGMTWLESSQARAVSLKKVIEGMNYELGGCGKNEKHVITENIIELNYNGENGDGTSGAKSPYEVSEKSVQWYTQQGIPENLWKSNAQEAPYKNLEEYTKFQQVKIVVYGDVVKTETNEIINFKYLKMKEKGEKFKIEATKHQNKQPKQGVVACPIHN